MSDDRFAAWKAEMAGKPRGLPAGVAGDGWYRIRTQEGWLPTAIWTDRDGDQLARIGDRDTVMVDATWCERYFSRAKAVTADEYKNAIQGRGWPDEAALPAPKQAEPAATSDGQPRPNTPPDDSALIDDERQELERSATAYLKTIDGKVDTQEKADAIAKIVEKARDLKTRAEGGKREAKRPSLDESARLERIWAPVVTGCDSLAKMAKRHLDDFLKAETARKQAEAKARAAEGKTVTAADTKVKAGKVHLAVTTHVQFDDFDKAWAQLVTDKRMKENRVIFDVLKQLVNQMLRAGETVEGARLVETQSAR